VNTQRVAVRSTAWLGRFRTLPGDNDFIGADGARNDLPTFISLSDFERRLEVARILGATGYNLCFPGTLHVDTINGVLDVGQLAAELDMRGPSPNENEISGAYRGRALIGGKVV
jgi:hypothetical protein